MLLLAGLGNPGSKYALTRHNIGFMALDLWLRSVGSDASDSAMKNEHKALTQKLKLKSGSVEKEILIVKPQTFMNLSGESVQALMHFYKIDKKEILVIHDDIDQTLGGLKIQFNRGHGGQNGVRSISEKLGGADYYRLKLGVGRPPHPDFEVGDYVLSPFTKTEQPIVISLLEKSAEAIDSFIWDGADKAASLYNTKA